jgi:ssDNA-binding Zn-finger/Zn-ribbon topoisomerase 1
LDENTTWQPPKKRLSSQQALTKIKPPFSSASDLTLELIQKIEWRHFEFLCFEYFKAKNYKVRETEKGKDGGIDLYLYKTDAIEADLKYQKPVACVQCKSWQTRKVGVNVVRELYGVMAAENIAEGIVASAGEFSEDAIAFAKDKKIQLLDGVKLLALIKQLPEQHQMVILTRVVKGDYTTPSCPTCDVKLIKRVSKKAGGSAFWGCVNYPKCKYTLKDKSISKDESTTEGSEKIRVNNEDRLLNVAPKKKLKRNKKNSFLGLVFGVVSMLIIGMIAVNMLTSIINNYAVKTQQTQQRALEKIKQQQKPKEPVKVNDVNKQNIVSEQELREQQRLFDQAQRLKKERLLNEAFNQQFVASPACVHPTEAMFVKCVNDRMRAKREFMSAHSVGDY